MQTYLNLKNFFREEIFNEIAFVLIVVMNKWMYSFDSIYNVVVDKTKN